MLELLFGFVVLCALLAIPILLLGLVFRVFFELILIPFHVIGALFEVAFAGVGVALKLLVGLVVAVLSVFVLPLLPLLLVGVLIWGFARLLQPRRVMVVR